MYPYDVLDNQEWTAEVSGWCCPWTQILHDRHLCVSFIYQIRIQFESLAQLTKFIPDFRNIDTTTYILMMNGWNLFAGKLVPIHMMLQWTMQPSSVDHLDIQLRWKRKLTSSSCKIFVSRLFINLFRNQYDVANVCLCNGNGADIVMRRSG